MIIRGVCNSLICSEGLEEKLCSIETVLKKSMKSQIYGTFNRTVCLIKSVEYYNRIEHSNHSTMYWIFSKL